MLVVILLIIVIISYFVGHNVGVVDGRLIEKSRRKK